MNWWKASISTVSAQLIRLLSGLIIIKIIALNLGPEGFGKLGHFMSIIGILTVSAGGGILNGVVKYVSEYKNTHKKLQDFISTAIIYSLTISTLIFIILHSLAGEISFYLYTTDEYKNVFRFLAYLQFIYAIVTICNGIVNGLTETTKFARIIIIGSLIGLPISYYCITEFGFLGSVIGLAIINAVLVIPGIFEVKRLKLIDKIFSYPNFVDLKKLSKFSLMQFTSLTTLPLAEIYIRSVVTEYYGWHQVGIWQSLLRLSSVYIGFFTMFLAAYYMPTLSGIMEKNKVYEHVIKYVKNIGFSFFLIAIIIYFAKEPIFSLVFSKSFIFPSEYILFQLIGDLFKVCSYVIGFLLVAKASIKYYIIAELFQVVLYFGGTLLFINKNNSTNLYMAYAISSFVYFFICIVGLYCYKKNILNI